MRVYYQLFITFVRVGMFTIGGGYAMIPMVENEVVEKRKWIDRTEFLDMIAMAQSAPGVFAINTAIFVGYKVKGFRGSLFSTLGCALPSFIIILLVAIFFVDIKSNPLVEKLLKGIRPVVVALIAAPALRMAKEAKLNWKSALIPIAGAIAIWLLGVSPMIIILTGVIGGVLWGRINKQKKV